MPVVKMALRERLKEGKDEPRGSWRGGFQVEGTAMQMPEAEENWSDKWQPLLPVRREPLGCGQGGQDVT